MPTKIVSLGRVEMCEDNLTQIENSINASRAISKYTQGHDFFTGTYNGSGWDLGYWVDYLKETSYEDPREVIDYLELLPKDEVITILKKYGLTDKESKKLLK